MGCSNTKPAMDEIVVDPEGAPAAGSSKRKTRNRRKYHSDVQKQKPAHSAGLVHESSMRAFHDKYDTANSMELGRGACGSVCTVRNRNSDEVYAMKTVRVDDMGGWEELRNEIEMQKKLSHPNIVKILESFEDKNRAQVYIIMELCTGGSLVSRMKTHRHGYGERAAATLIEKMLSAVIYCHHHGVVHRDIKLDNMIYENESEEAELKLIDFGFAKAVAPEAETMYEQLGTPSYMAPELWSDHEVPYNSSVDMWAIGVCAYMLLSGQRPFHHGDKREKARMIREDPLNFPEHHWSHLTPDARDFCSSLMKKHPEDRLSASEAVKHSWIVKQSKIHMGDSAELLLAKHEEVVDSLEKYAHVDDLSRLALEVIAFSAPPSKLEELREIFHKMDLDDSGTISFEEFKDALKGHPEIDNEHLRELFDKMDAGHNGEIDYTEFLAATVSSQKNMVARGSIKAAFATLDRNGDGYICKHDLEQAMDGIESPSLKKYMAMAENGKISFRTFQSVVVQEMKSPSISKSSEKHFNDLSEPRKSSKNILKLVQ